MPEPRRLASDAVLLPQTVTRVESVLVSTGVHSSNVIGDRSRDQEGDQVDDCRRDQNHCHRDFSDVTGELFVPTVCVDDVKHAVEYILHRQHDIT